MKTKPIQVRYSAMLYLTYLLLMGFSSQAQVNYVGNGGFEQYSKCPYGADQIKFATGWQPIDTLNHPAQNDSFGSPNCTPEYCNTCAGINSFAGVPNNGVFYHYPHTVMEWRKL